VNSITGEKKLTKDGKKDHQGIAGSMFG